MAGKIDFQPINWSRFDQMKALDNAFARIEGASSIQAMVPDVEIKTDTSISKAAYSNDQVRNDVVGMFFDRFA
jgi:hypothetical protein